MKKKILALVLALGLMTAGSILVLTDPRPASSTLIGKAMGLRPPITKQEAQSYMYKECYMDLWHKIDFTPEEATAEMVRATKKRVEDYCKEEVDK